MIIKKILSILKNIFQLKI